MRIGLVVVATLCLMSNIAYAQQWQTVFYIDSRVGYSSNTYLNPYLSEWDRSAESGYGTVSALGQTAWFDDKNVAEFTGGVVFEPFLNNRHTWKGGLALANYSRKLSDNLTAGIEAGGSYFSSSFERTLVWGQPVLSWFPTPFTNVRVKAGSNYRKYSNYQVDSIAVNSKDLMGLYALEFDTWPSFRWQLSAGLYGNLGTLPSIGKGFRSIASSTHIFDHGEQLSFTIGIEQYHNQYTATIADGGGGLPPGSDPTVGTELIRQTSRIFRIGVNGSYPVNKKLSLFLNLEGLEYHSEILEDNVRDMQISGGVRLTITPSRLAGQRGIEPSWNKEPSWQQVKIRYTGEGQLYLVGDFNNWKRPGIPLVEQDENRYTAQLNLAMGSYEYKVLKVNAGEEEWVSFSENTYTVDDGYGGENAMLLIEQ